MSVSVTITQSQPVIDLSAVLLASWEFMIHAAEALRTPRQTDGQTDDGQTDRHCPHSSRP